MRTTLLATAAAVLLTASPAAAAPRLPANATRAAVPEPCPPEYAVGYACGHVTVPLDRGHPAEGTTSVFFAVLPHSQPGPAQSAVFVNFGGPGAATSSLAGVPQFWLGDATRQHDLLLVDDRGSGHSGAIDCPAHQHGTLPTVQAVAACADQLGPRADDYSSADIAADDEAVRIALGYGRVDFVGTSFGGIDAVAYATRYPGHLRSVVLDTPATATAPSTVAGVAVSTQREVRRAGLICARSALCARSRRETVTTIARLARRLRRSPLTGTGPDADGNPHPVTIDARYLLVHVLDSPGFPFTTGEIPAAADALARGDTAPLLRLGAEGDFAIPGDAGDPAQFSQGAFSATLCVDADWPWAPDASLARRQAQWAAVAHGTPDRMFAPFTADEILLSPFSLADFCLAWPGTGTRPPVEPGARYPDVPMLAVDGELDIGSYVREAAAAFPHSTYVEVTGAGHNAFSRSDCARGLEQEFLQTLAVRDASCAATSTLDYPGVGRFARRVADEPAVRAMAGSRVRRRGRRVARAAVDAALDALRRSIVTGADGVGLRGGTFHPEFGDDLTLTLTGARWTQDVPVDGTLHWSFEDGTLNADLHVDGGALHVEGGWLVPGSPRTLTITGKLHGRRVAATMPSS
jgi:pimeloyl-ACP methyl ester carboxylesterase